MVSINSCVVSILGSVVSIIGSVVSLSSYIVIIKLNSISWIICLAKFLSFGLLKAVIFTFIVTCLLSISSCVNLYLIPFSFEILKT